MEVGYLLLSNPGSMCRIGEDVDSNALIATAPVVSNSAGGGKTRSCKMEWIIPRNCDGKKIGLTALRMGFIVFSSLWIISVILLGELRWWLYYMPQNRNIWLLRSIALYAEDVDPSSIYQQRGQVNEGKPVHLRCSSLFKRWANKWGSKMMGAESATTTGHSLKCSTNEKTIIAWRKEIKARSRPSQLIQRSRAVKHDIATDGNIIRYMELCHHSRRCSGDSFIDHMEQTYSPLRGIPAQPVINLAAHGIIFVGGKDREGHPLVHLRPRQLGKLGYSNPTTIADAMNLLIYSIERAVSMMSVGVTKVGVIVDCRGVNLNSLPPIVRFFIMDAFQLISKHYPMRLQFALFLHTNHVVNNVWRVASVVLDKRVLQKVKFMSGPGLRTELGHKIPNSVIDAYGLYDDCENGNSSIQNIGFDAKDYFAKNPLGTRADTRQ